MKRVHIVSILLFSILKLNAQGHVMGRCSDTVNIKGYYVVPRLKSEIGQLKIIEENDETINENGVDVHVAPFFIPFDSVTTAHNLADRISSICGNSNQVFLTCKRLSSNSVNCLCKVKLGNCDFPDLKSNIFYETTNIKSDEVYEILFLDANWAKIKIHKESRGSSFFSNMITGCLSENANVFDFYYFIKCNSFKIKLKIQDSHLVIWKNEFIAMLF